MCIIINGKKWRLSQYFSDICPAETISSILAAVTVYPLKTNNVSKKLTFNFFYLTLYWGNVVGGDLTRARELRVGIAQ